MGWALVVLHMFFLATIIHKCGKNKLVYIYELKSSVNSRLARFALLPQTGVCLEREDLDAF
jgi:hypothetical protein